MRKLKRTPVQVDPEHCRAYLLAKQQRDEAEAAMANYRTMIEAVLGDITAHQAGPYQILRPCHTRQHLDQKALKRENPGIAQQYTVSREVRTFTIALDHAAVLS